MLEESGEPSTFRLEPLERRTLLSGAFLAQLPATPTLTVSTVPPNGDVNPYGVAIVPGDIAGGGKLHAGDVLVSNFNDSANVQGTGTTIVDISPSGKQTVFFQGKTGLGLTTALGVLSRGFVLVGNVPAPNGVNVKGPGSLLILDRNGKVVETLSDPELLDGPWDLTVYDQGATAEVFVSNVLSGTVTRIDLAVPSYGDDVRVLSETQIASGYTFRTDPNALVVGPTGLALDAATDTLFVASTGNNAIYSISDALRTGPRSGRGQLVYKDNSHLRGPLALAFAPNGDLLEANGDAVNPDPSGKHNSEIVEFTTSGKFVDELQINPTAGGAFGLATGTFGNEEIFAAVNDITNQVEIWDLPLY
jgi:hypothetical protein